MTTITTSPLQIIKTKFLPPTNTKGARVKATTASGKSTVMPWDHGVGADFNHREVCEALITKMQWYKPGDHWVGGADWSGNCYTFINITRHVQKHKSVKLADEA